MSHVIRYRSAHFRSAATLFSGGLFCLSLASCGGGGSDSCEAGAGYSIKYELSEPAAFSDALSYKLGTSNRWTLQAKNMSSACLRGMKVAVPPGRPPLPAGVTLNAATGELSTGVMTTHIEGYCTYDGGTITGTSRNRVCPAGQTFNDSNYVILIQTDAYNNSSSPVLTAISFRPAP